MQYVYILHSLKDMGLYIGYTTDLRKRYQLHQDGKVLSTKHRLPVKLIYYESYLNRIDAKKREIFLKSGSGHRFIKKQLSNYLRNNPLAR
ncbi:MAG: GIY-YIG nuclease family protein [Minisyncoccia bacterium]